MSPGRDLCALRRSGWKREREDAWKSPLGSLQSTASHGARHAHKATPSTDGPLRTAATYLGLTPAELRAQIESEKTLAQVAADQGKSVDGLKAAIIAGAKTELDRAVAAGKITAAQEQKMLDELKSHVDNFVNGAGFVRKTVTA